MKNRLLVNNQEFEHLPSFLLYSSEKGVPSDLQASITTGNTAIWR
jgi:hypothetical protein